jgi:hypothetical protein
MSNDPLPLVIGFGQVYTAGDILNRHGMRIASECFT